MRPGEEGAPPPDQCRQYLEEWVPRFVPYHLDLGPVGTFGGLSGFVYISAQLQSSGTVTCEIKKGDQVIQSATSSGEYVIASCSGSV